jgi:four helix bundle protein
MNSEDFKMRTKAFGVRIIKLAGELPRTTVASVIGRQLLRSGTAVGANYRAACRARSGADFISKMGIVEEECDESLYWMEMLIESNTMKQERLSLLMNEDGELLSMVVASINTARRKSKSAIRNPQSAIPCGNPVSSGPLNSGRDGAANLPKSAIRNPQSAIL